MPHTITLVTAHGTLPVLLTRLCEFPESAYLLIWVIVPHFELESCHKLGPLGILILMLSLISSIDTQFHVVGFRWSVFTDAIIER